MSRVGRRALLLGLLLAALSCGRSEWDGNVVLIVIDTLRVEGLPFHGGPAERAPFLNELAKQSRVFERAWSASSWTAPATASIFTSTYPNEHGVVLGLRAYRSRRDENQEIELNRLPPALETIPGFLAARGLRTFGVSGNLNIDAVLGFERGFDRFEMVDYGDSSDGRSLVTRLLEWRDEILSGDPFFLYLHFMDPHGPYHRHAAWVPDDAPPPPRRPLKDRTAYDSEIRFVDEQIRRLFRELPLERSLVIVTSDHGQEFADHGGYGHRFQLYSELTQVPLLLRMPGESAARVSGNVSNLDVLPTLRAAFAAPPAPQDRGRSLLDGAAGSPGRPVFAMRTLVEGERRVEKRAVVKGSLKLIVTDVEGFRRSELYDLERDAGEQQDLAASRPDDVASLLALLDEQAASIDASVHEAAAPVEATPELIQKLEALGYVEEREP